ncbi:hypothetical protein WN51_11061 [Melipona quadrifasciata]|uniref:CCHC-type domain-containing protein n=1 Tax=Melipona quadrifasciata TaxID=166423 RepID=A0A0M9A585_9HYME|nr:hypothetical protein WN51_11061 [Melipona quadrifasciata]
MYVSRGLRPEFDPNVRVLETQRNIPVCVWSRNPEERKKKRRLTRDRESVRKVKGQKGDIYCYNCETKGHMAVECDRDKRCFNCQRFNHIAAECHETRKRVTKQQEGRNELAMKTSRDKCKRKYASEQII